MKALTVLAALLLGTSVQAAAPSSFGKANQSVESASLISLIANPEKYDGRQVRLIGAFQLEFEGHSFCLHKDDLSQHIHANCLWVDPDFEALGIDRMTLSGLNGQYVLLEGTFHKDNRGHRGLYAGSVGGVWRVTSWEQAAR
jgi:hypothetical protein